jgi:uncharacterized membrane protein
MAKTSSDPVGTLTVGNVVSASTTLYKSNFKRYFQVSLRATGWGFTIVLAAILLSFVGGILFGLINSWLVAIPLGLGWIGFTLYCLARYATDRAVISRLAYQELIDRPETVAAATQQLVPRAWGFLRLSWLLGLCMSLVIFVGYILLALGIGICAGILGTLNLTANPLAIGLVVIIGIGLFCLWILAIIRYYSYWFVAELPLAIESTSRASVGMRRSKELSNTAVGRLQLIIFIAFLITLPISVLGNSPSFVGQFMASPVFSPDKANQAIGSTLMVGGFLLGMISELFIMPFWQAIKAVIYYDLRNRREGGDLVI